MSRVFVALDLPDDVKATLAALPGRFDGARWVTAASMHLTMRFIGETERVAEIIDLLSTARATAFELAVRGVGQFPRNQRQPPRVLWAGVAAPDSLLSLYEIIETVLVPLHLPRDNHPFSPHITLARVPSPAPAEQARQFLAQNAALASDPFPVTGFTLYQTMFVRGAPVYEPVATFAF